MPTPARRTLLKSAALAVAASPLTWEAPTGARAFGTAAEGAVDADLHWLERRTPAAHAGLTWGVPWARRMDGQAAEKSGDRPRPRRTA